MSLSTSVKDYVEITHKLIEIEPLKNYTEFGAIFTYFIFSIGEFLRNFFSFSFIKNIWSIPVIIPDIASAMISEVSILDGYFHNAFTFLETNVNTSTNTNLVFFEKFMIGLINSFFLILPTSTSHLITLRRFVMQGLEAGYIAGLGTLAGNFLWLASIILGCRFFVIPWLSLDIFRYLLGFILLVKYIWDSSKERRMALEDLSKWKIFLLNFLLALTEQSCIYPFISNLSIGPDASILEGFPVENYTQFLTVHGAYLLGIFLGSFSLLQFTCWFWENPAFSIYLWITTKSSLKISTSSYYKILNFTFLYATMLCAIASIPYYGLDYTITNPIGLVPQDRILDQKKSPSDPDKLITETAFLGVNPTDKNARIRDGVHARRERWKQRLIKYQAFDASVYDQGVYDFLTIEDLNYGFDRFWLRRKMRNHQIRFRLFPGPWMRSLKKQLNNPPNPSASTENNTKISNGPRVEFFRILFEQFYHPNFHDRNKIKTDGYILKKPFGYGGFGLASQSPSTLTLPNSNLKPGLISTNSALRKYVRNVSTRTNLKLLNNPSLILTQKDNSYILAQPKAAEGNFNLIYSKRWKSIFSKLQPKTKTKHRKSYQLFRNVAKQLLLTNNAQGGSTQSLKITTINQKLSTKERRLLKLRSIYTNSSNVNNKLMLLRPLSVYLQKEQAFKRKLHYYGTTPMRKLTVGNQAPYFKALMKRSFYYYKPSLRWKKTLYVASMRRGFRKKSRKQRILLMPTSQTNSFQQEYLKESSPERSGQQIVDNTNSFGSLDKSPSANYSSYTVLGKRASRYRHQIYKDVLQHWYYTPFNRLLLKFDVDAFINRQPKSHFLTKNEERILHIRRFLLSEHYDTLRWYTYMQHYKTMKTNIGGTKSFVNRVYNQQFQGTLKKIRHLFAITPQQGDLYTLKFDQPLYNDNKLKDNVYLHEELQPLSSPLLFSQDLPTENNLIRQEEPLSLNNKGLLNSNNINKRQLAEGDVGFANETKNQDVYIAKGVENLDLINQSSLLLGKNYFKTSQDFDVYIAKGEAEGLKNLNDVYIAKGDATFVRDTLPVYNELFIKLIKECKKRIHDQTFLKNYITHRIEKREQLNQEQTKELNKRLEKLKNWLNSEPQQKDPILTIKNVSVSALASQTLPVTKVPTPSANYPSSIQKAINDSINISDSNMTKPTPSANYHLKYFENQILNKLNVINDFKNISNNCQSALGSQTLPVCKYESKSLIKTNFNQQLRLNLDKIKKLLENATKNIKINNYVQTYLLQTRTDKNLQWWRKKQQVITKRKNSRKRDRFKKQIAVVNKKLEALRKKADTEKSNLYKTLYGNYEISQFLTNPKTMDSSLLRRKQDNTSNQLFNLNNNSSSTSAKGFFNKKLRKKVSSKGRRYRSLSLARYLTATRKPRLVYIDNLTKIDNITNLKGSYLTNEEKEKYLASVLNKNNITNSLKNSQIKKRSRHSWKKRARHQFSRNHYKYRKRHIHGNGKLRVMNKKIKKFKATNELRQWWWTSFLPRYLNTLVNVKSDKNSLITSSFKPLSSVDNIKFNNIPNSQVNSSNEINMNLFTSNISNQVNNPIITTSLPFYAGWDESLRKFVVTNRILSRRDAGLTVKDISFTNAPIQGLNEGSFLYWQTEMPFNTYNIDQFITTNQSFYAPLGWRRFEFRHSILKTWANKNQTIFNQQQHGLNQKNNISSIIVSLNNKVMNLSSDQKNTKKTVARRIKKRYKLLKQTPNILMYSPTGPLLTQVLPAHYISVFDQQYRFPRNRYLKRNTLKTLKKTTLLTMVDSYNQTNGITKEFTLRKRVKPRRKYHRKRFIKKDGLIFPRRTKFTTNKISLVNSQNDETDLRWRPSSRSKQKRKETARTKIKSNKRVKTNPLRLRQLRRREFQQILKPTQRFVPHNGGFAWPGDYLRLEIVEMPKLKTTNEKKTSLKQKINVQPVGIMSRKYLIEKHNILVLKKKLEKAYSSHQFNKTIQDYKNLIKN